MKTSNFFRLLLITVSAISLVMVSCDKNSSEPKDDQQENLDQQTQQNAQAAYYSTLYAEAMALPASAISTVTSVNALAKTNGVTEDTLFTGCPTIVFYPFRKDIVMDWGSGCTGASGLYTSGSIRMHGSFEGDVLVFAASFNNFSSEGFSVNGDVKFVGTPEYVQVTIQNGTITENDSVYYISGNLHIAVDNNSTPDDFYDDIYTITGTFNVTSNQQPPLLTEITIRDSAPLKYRATCEYPYTGIMDFKTNDLGTGYADFSPINQACDPIVKFYSSEGGSGQTVNMDEL